MNLDGNRDRSSAFVKDEDSVLLKDVELYSRTMDPVVPHSFQRQVAEARPEHT